MEESGHTLRTGEASAAWTGQEPGWQGSMKMWEILSLGPDGEPPLKGSKCLKLHFLPHSFPLASCSPRLSKTQQQSSWVAI